MKTNKAVKINANTVGVEVMNIQDAVKAQAAGLELVDKEGWEYDYYTIVDDESGEERNPTEQEMFDRIAKDLADGKEVYACMTLANDWCVQKRAVTTMRTNFCVGQEVYLMRDNKIAKDKILRINLVKDEDSEYCKLVLMGDQAHYTKGGYVFATKQELVESLMKE